MTLLKSMFIAIICITAVLSGLFLVSLWFHLFTKFPVVTSFVSVFIFLTTVIEIGLESK